MKKATDSIRIVPVLVALMTGAGQVAWGDIVDIVEPETTLHVYCTAIGGGSTCPEQTIGGVPVRPVEWPLPEIFGFYRSPNSNNKLSGPVFTLVVMAPNITGNNALDIKVTGRYTGVTSPVTATLANSGAQWTGTPDPSSHLITDFLGLTQKGGPPNPINAWLPATQSVVPSATGYFVYRANMGAVSFSATTDPHFTFQGTLPLGTMIAAYITDTTGGNTGKVTDTTAQSSAAFVGVIVPEPATGVLVGLGILALGTFLRRRVA